MSGVEIGPIRAFTRSTKVFTLERDYLGFMHIRGHNVAPAGVCIQRVCVAGHRANTRRKVTGIWEGIGEHAGVCACSRGGANSLQQRCQRIVAHCRGGRLIGAKQSAQADIAIEMEQRVCIEHG